MRILPSNLALFAGPVGDKDIYIPGYVDVFTNSSGQVFTYLLEDVLVTGFVPSSLMRELYGVKGIDINNQIDLLETDVYGAAEKLLEYPGFSEQKVTFSYYCDGFSNEASLGLFTGISTGAFYNINRNEERNLYLFVAPGGWEAKGLGGADGRVIALGNGFLTSYSVSAAIGSYAEASASFDFLNMSSHENGVSFQNPSIVSGLQYTGVLTLPTVSGSIGRPGIVRPGEIQISLNNGIFQSQDALIQGFKLDFNIEKENIPVAGQRYPRRICPKTPEINLSIDVLSTRDFITGSVFSYLCRTGSNDITVTFRQKCRDLYDFVSRYKLQGLVYNGESFSSQGQGAQVTTMSWKGQSGIYLGSAEYYYMSPSGEYYLDPEGNYYTYIE